MTDEREAGWAGPVDPEKLPADLGDYAESALPAEPTGGEPSEPGDPDNPEDAPAPIEEQPGPTDVTWARPGASREWHIVETQAAGVVTTVCGRRFLSPDMRESTPSVSQSTCNSCGTQWARAHTS